MLKKTFFTASAITLLMGTHNVLAAENYQYVCSANTQTRIIEVNYLAPPAAVPCQVNYIKGHETQLLWQASNSAGFCEEKAETFMQKQQGWGFSCEKQQASQLTTAEPASPETDSSEAEHTETLKTQADQELQAMTEKVEQQQAVATKEAATLSAQMKTDAEMKAKAAASDAEEAGKQLEQKVEQKVEEAVTTSEKTVQEQKAEIPQAPSAPATTTK